MTGTRLRPMRQDHDLEVLLRTPIHEHMGLREAEPGNPDAGLMLVCERPIANNSLMLHGGMIATSIDCAAAYAMFPTLSDDEVIMTSSLSISYMRPVPIGSEVRIRAEIVRRGRNTAFLTVTVRVGEKLIATAQIVKSIVHLDED
ncbi:uncharacterized protein (TIGR00369 family) [Microbacterium sp. W4I4]|uniref:PaaI family thioesterase n=1 Tax=Microbacterium sp. W4I4 TaxID=3042295 RepID=UPI00277D3305|nr:PaaI family thioesterase [Microbacterium sp. W4I4]MDQ0614266.1 uncharacterized protein (TIGR00369 family) [Microbacterium sp. W4I4]